LAATAAQAGRVDQDELAVSGPEGRIDGIARGTGLVVYQDPFLAQQAVDQGGLARVGLAHEGEANRDGVLAGALAGGGGLGLAEHRHGRVEQLGHAPPMTGGNAEDLREAQGVALGQGGVAQGRIHLVDGDQDGLAGPAQKARHVFVHRGHALGGVEHQHEQIGLVHGAQGLRAHGGQDAQGLGIEPAGVDHAEARCAPGAYAVAPIAGDAGHVLDQGRPPPHQPVEERGLAHVGPADQREHGQTLALRRPLAAATVAHASSLP
jgi:hypothetical protein